MRDINQESDGEIDKIISAGRIVMSSNPTALLKDFRRNNGITQTKLARYLEITPSTIAKYEKNIRKNPGCITVKKWVDAVIEIKKKERPESVSVF